MKQLLTVTLLFVAILFSNNIFAQKTYKFGHIDSNQLLSIMPEREKAKTDLEKHAKQLETTLMSMQSEIELKYDEYLRTADSLPQLIRQAKEKEIGDMQQRFQTFQQNAQQDLSAKEGELLKPIVDKAKKAIEDVAAERGYIYVFDLGTGGILYHSPDSEDILPFVKTKLGIQ